MIGVDAFEQFVTVLAERTADYVRPAPEELDAWSADLRRQLAQGGIAGDAAERAVRDLVGSAVRFADLVAEAGGVARHLIELTEKLDELTERNDLE